MPAITSRHFCRITIYPSKIFMQSFSSLAAFLFLWFPDRFRKGIQKLPEERRIPLRHIGRTKRQGFDFRHRDIAKIRQPGMGYIRCHCKCIPRVHQGKQNLQTIAEKDLAGLPAAYRLALDSKQTGG